MKTIDSDNDYNNFNSYNNKVEETTDLLINGNGDTLLRCNADLAKSFNVLKSTPPMGHKGRFYQRVLLKSNNSANVTEDSRSKSLPNSLEKNKSLNGSDIETVECCDIESKLLPTTDGDSPPVSPVFQDLWFKTWPERYDKLKTNDTDPVHSEGSSSNGYLYATCSSTQKSPVVRKNDVKKVTLNEALENISLAYSPITKQLHFVKKDIVETSKVEESDDIINKIEDNTLCPENVRPHHSRSSTISSLSDFSPSGSLLDPDERTTPTKDLSESKSCKKKKGTFFNKNVFSWKLFAKAKDDGSIPHSPQHCNVIASSSALILNKRPSTLPAKNEAEEQRHREEYQAILIAAKKKEALNNAAKQKQQKIQLQLEEQQANATKYFTHTVLANWDTMYCVKKTKDLWWHGLPSSVRGKVWRLAIGNDLNLTPQLHDICLSRAQIRLSSPEPPEIDTVNIDQESSLDVIQLDIARTFPNLCIFQEGGPYSEVLHSLLAAYVCYRPDVGYVQGMSYIAAILILNMDPYDAFVCFANLLNKPLHIAAFTLNQHQMQSYYKAFNEIFNYSLPKLYLHFVKSGLTPDMYLLDWIYTVYAKAMPLDVACRVWDVFLRDGDEFLFRTGLGILHLHQDTLMKMDFLHGAQFLTRLPEDMSSDQLFKSIQMVSTNVGKQTFGQIVEKCLSSNDT
ncbi:TBC1 domain family member 14-like [Onthophagus taurus]|uniref:TBC1 domain family member 14-like n=1 Tax=Onthophagus taurus TaxID=166361 RepID=UPI0039BE1100